MMPNNLHFPPEGLRPPILYTLSELKSARESGEILEGTVLRCDTSFALHVSLGPFPGILPREEVNAPWISGSERDIAVLSRVGKRICFTVKGIISDSKGAPLALLSRKEAQEKAMDHFLEHLIPGDVLTGRVTRLESFGAFVDIGCGIIAMLPIEHISVSRIDHPRARFRPGQKILAVVRTLDRERRRITLSHRELLGTWLENASLFQPGETVQGIVRSVKDYGLFIELTPNLSGLANTREDIHLGDGVSVFIKSIRPERMKIKLHVIEKLGAPPAIEPLRYQITDGTLDRWVYSPSVCDRAPIETDFTALSP